MSKRRSRWRENLKTAATLARSDVLLHSIVLYPIRRHLRLDNKLKLRQGITLSAPNEEPLLSLFQEVWVRRHYSIPGFAPKSGDVIVDVGAHIGVFTVWAASRDPNARVIAVEPSAATLKYLHHNVETNKLTNVTIVDAACGSSDGMVEMLARGPAACNTTFRSDNYGSSFAVIGNARKITLKRLFSDFAIDHCDLLKLDCEGAEYDTLYSAPEATLSRVERIAMEYHIGMNRVRP